ncbi:MAG: hypothetical protein IJM32_06915 [Ruminococcus sp.]|nr:hypothetical protein [Ruminococcus sp.]
MKDYKQMSESVLQRVHEYEEQNESTHARVRSVGKVSAIVLPVLALAAVGIFALSGGFGGSGIGSGSSDTVGGNDHIGQYGSNNSDAGDTSEKRSESSTDDGNDHIGQYGSNNSDVDDTSEKRSESSSEAESSSQAAVTTTSNAVSKTTESKSGGKIDPNERFGGQTMIAAIPKNNRTQVIGEKITEEEARDYFTKNAASLESSLAASGVEIAEIWYDGAESNFMGTVLCAKGSLLFKKGYCHVSYDGNTDESKPGLTVKQNFMDFHVYNADRLVAIVTLVKENGLIYATPAFGAPWFDSFDKALKKYAGQKVLFLYAGAMAYAIAPDGKVIHPQGYESSVKDSGLDKFPDAYNWFYNEQCVYTP